MYKFEQKIAGMSAPDRPNEINWTAAGVLITF